MKFVDVFITKLAQTEKYSNKQESELYIVLPISSSIDASKSQ